MVYTRRMSVPVVSPNRNPFFVYYRGVALLCILFHHSLTACSGGWPPNECLCLPSYPLFGGVSSLCKYIGLGCFTFMAGFFSINSMQKYSLPVFLKKKLYHIILPCLIWGGVYYLLFPQFVIHNAPINGSHLWYLPMVFLCFLSALSLGYGKYAGVGIGITVAVFLGVKVAACTGALPSGAWWRPVRELNTFLPVFTCGCLAGRYSESHVLRIAFRCIIVFGILMLYLLPGRNPSGFLYLFFPVILYTIAPMKGEKQLPLPSVLKSIDQHSFNIYILHQFIINLVILLTELHVFSEPCPYYLLFIITLIVSWCLAVIMTKTMICGECLLKTLFAWRKCI